MSLEKFGFTNSRVFYLKKKAKIDKKTRDKIYDDEKKSQNICTNMDRDLSMGKICWGKNVLQLCHWFQ